MTRSNPILAYLASGAALLLALLLRLFLDRWLHDSVPMVTLFAAVAVAVWIGGYRPAILVTVVGYIAFDWFFVEPRHEFDALLSHNLVALGACLVTSAVIIALGQAMRSAHRRAQRAMRKLQIVTATMSTPVTRCNRDFEYVWVSNGFAEWLGRPAGEILGRHVRDVMGAAAFDMLRPHFERVLRGETVTCESQVPIEGLGSRWIIATCTPTFEDGDACDGWVAAMHDISELKEVEQQTKDDLDAILRLQAVANLCAASNSDPTECVHEILEAAIAFTAADRGTVQLLDEVSGTLYFAAQRGFESAFLDRFGAVSPDDATTCAAAMCSKQRVVVGDVAASDIFAGQRSLELFLDNGIRAVQSTPLISNSGALIGMISTHYDRPAKPDERALRWLDLLARQAGDYLERIRVQHALLESEERYRSLFESIDQGFCVIKVLFNSQNNPVDYRFLAVNPAFERQTGISDPTGRSMREIAPFHEEEWFQTYGRIAMTGEPVRFENEAAQLNRHYEVYAWRIGDPSEHKVAILFNDITQRKRHEEALREADRRKDEFLAVLSHELRNPLAPIGYATRILRREPLAPAELQWVRSVLDRQVHQMGRLLDDLMDVSRITRGTIELRKQHVALRAVLNDAIEATRPLINDAGHTLSVEIPTDIIVLDADPTRLAQVFQNLLTNAAKYTERGGQIRLEAWLDDGHVTVRVKDNGVGIRPAMMDHIFEMFVQDDRSIERARGGLGIGLTLVRKLVEMHGGAVGVHSDGPGLGSEFTVRLPIVSATPVLEPVPGVPAHDHATNETARRVLVVDDNRDSVEGMAAFLSGLGHDVRTALDGVAAVEEARAFRPDAVILDIGLPKMNGYDAARQIREHLGRDVVLIALTGWGQDGDRRRSSEAGFDRHLTKPVDIDELQKIISTVRIPAAEPNLRPAA